jgi:hypothetical protein
MTKDNTEATRTTSNGELNLSDAEQLCRAVHVRASNPQNMKRVRCPPHAL